MYFNIIFPSLFPPPHITAFSPIVLGGQSVKHGTYPTVKDMGCAPGLLRQLQPGTKWLSTWQCLGICTVSSDWCHSVTWNSLTELEMSIHIQSRWKYIHTFPTCNHISGTNRSWKPNSVIEMLDNKCIIFYYHILKHQASDWSFIKVSENCTGTSE